VGRLGELIDGGFEIREYDIHWRVMVAVEVEQFVEDVSTVKATGVLVKFLTCDDLIDGTRHSIGDTTTNVPRVMPLALPVLVLSPPVLVALDEIVRDE